MFIMWVYRYFYHVSGLFRQQRFRAVALLAFAVSILKLNRSSISDL